MKKLSFVLIIMVATLSFLFVNCKGKSDVNSSAQETAKVKTTLFDKTLPEIKELVNGEWELVSGKNARETCEYENTFIKFDGDKYVWIEDGKEESGDLNWRKADTGIGYESYLMDVFYATSPAFPLTINGDTLQLQDCSETAYLYTLVRK